MHPKNLPKIIDVLLCILFLLSLLTNLCVSVNYSVGVKPGDWIEHKFYYSGLPPSPYIVWVRREMLEVNGTWVRLNYTAVYSNGKIIREQIEGDVSKGPEKVFPALIPANMKEGDEISVESIPEAKIIIEWEGEKEIFNITRTLVNSTFEIGRPPFPTIKVSASWDKDSGILVRSFSIHRNFNLTVRLVGTNAWRIKQIYFYPLVIVIGIIFTIIMMIGMILYTLRKQGTAKITRKHRKP